MKKFALLSLLLNVTLQAQTNPWQRVEGSLLFTSATLWKIGRANPVVAQNPVGLLANAEIATNTRTNTPPLLVLDRTRANEPLNAFVPFSNQQGQNSSLVVSELVTKLRVSTATPPLPNMGFSLPAGDLQAVPPLPPVAGWTEASGTGDARRQTARAGQWFLLQSLPAPAATTTTPPAASTTTPPAASTTTPPAEPATTTPSPAGQAAALPPLQSVLMDWGPRATIETLRAGLYSRQGQTDQLVESRIYDKHFYRVPLELEMFSHTLDGAQGGTRVANITGLYAIRPRFTQQSNGYLVLVRVEGETQTLLLLELASYTFTGTGSSTFQIDIPSRCFLRHTVGVERALAGVDCARTQATSTSACRETAPNSGRFNIRVTGPAVAPVVAEGATPPAAPTANFDLATRNLSDAFEVRMRRAAQEVALTIPDTATKLVIPANSTDCRGVSLEELVRAQQQIGTSP